LPDLPGEDEDFEDEGFEDEDWLCGGSSGRPYSFLVK